MQVFLPDWDRTDSDFYLDGMVQFEGFQQGQEDAASIHGVPGVEYNRVREDERGEDILRRIKSLYDSKRSWLFVMTMSTKISHTRGGFIAWRNQLIAAGEQCLPVLVCTVASAPELADKDNGIVRWYIRSEDESTELANYFDNLDVRTAGVFAITRTAGRSDDVYGFEGAKVFLTRFDGNKPSDLQYFVTAKTARESVRDFLDKIRGRFSASDLGVFVVGYGNMVKNTLSELLEQRFMGRIACVSTLTDPQWRPSAHLLNTAPGRVCTVQPYLSSQTIAVGNNDRNVVFLFSRKTLLRVLRTATVGAPPDEFIRRWMNGEPPEEPHRLVQLVLANGDSSFPLKVVAAETLP